MGTSVRSIAWRVGPLTAIVLMAVLACAVPASTAATAAPGETMAPNSVVQLQDRPTTLALPADGRINSYELAANILGVAKGDTLQTGAGTIGAPSGQQLWVFGLAWTGETDDNGAPLPVTSAVVVDGAQINFPAEANSPNANSGSLPQDGTWQTGDTYWAASVPANAQDVAVQLSSGGYGQTFSLSKMRREGPHPTVLYRSPTTWEVTTTLTGEHNFPINIFNNDGLAGNIFQTNLTGATLSWFGPDGPSDTAANPATAWFVPDLNSGASLQQDCPTSLPPSDFALNLAGKRTPIRPTEFQGLGGDASNGGPYASAYGFQVPATITRFTLTITPGTLAGYDCYPGTATVTATGSATFPVLLTTPAWTPPADASAIPAQIHNLTASGASNSAASGNGADPVSTTRHSSGTSRGLIVGAVILAAAIAAGALLLIRRRRHTPASAATGPSTRPRLFAWPTPAPTPSATSPSPATTPPSAPPTLAPPRPAAGPAEVPPPRLDISEPPLPEGPELQILGPIRTTGWPAEPPATRPVVELAAFLVFHPDKGYTAEALRHPLSADPDHPLAVDSVRTYAGTLRRILGPERAPEGGHKGYRINGLSTDWQRFQEYAANDSPQSLANALRLVRGRPFEDAPEDTYRWAHTDDDLIVSGIEKAVTATATKLASRALEAGDIAVAMWAANKGLLVSRYSETLNGLALKAAAHTGQPDVLTQVWKDVTSRYAPDPPPDALGDLYRSLRDNPTRPPHEK